jgi:hypothetical protein
MIVDEPVTETIGFIANETDLPKSRVMILIDKTLCEVLNIPFQHVDLSTIHSKRQYLLRRLERYSDDKLLEFEF